MYLYESPKQALFYTMVYPLFKHKIAPVPQEYSPSIYCWVLLYVRHHSRSLEHSVRQTDNIPTLKDQHFSRVGSEQLYKITLQNLKCFVENKRRWCNSEWDGIGEQVTSAGGQGGEYEEKSLWGSGIWVEPEGWKEVSHGKTWRESIPETRYRRCNYLRK